MFEHYIEKALQVLTNLKPEECFNWLAIKRAIQHRFADLRRNTRLRYPTFDTRAQEELTLQAFMWGLQPDRLRELLRLFAPRTLTDAIAEGERVEHVLTQGIIPPP